MAEVSHIDEIEPTHEERQSGLFFQLVMQLSNMATLLLGKAPHPETGNTMRDLEGARMFIDQLEMLEARTKGNLTAPEEALLKQTLMSLRMNFVETIGQPVEPATPATEPQTLAGEAEAADDESKKRFTKKY